MKALQAGQLRIVNKLIAVGDGKNEVLWLPIYFPPHPHPDTSSTKWLRENDVLFLIEVVDSGAGWRVMSRFGVGKIFLSDIKDMTRKL